MSRFFIYILCFSTLSYPLNCKLFLSNRYKAIKGLTALSVKSGISKKNLNEAVTNLLYDGIERNFLSQKDIEKLLLKLEKSNDPKAKAYMNYFDDLNLKISKKRELAIDQKDSNIEYLLNSDLEIETKNFMLNLGKISGDEDILSKIQSVDLIILSKKSENLYTYLKTKKSKNLFIDLYKLIDHYSDNKKIALLSSFDHIFKYIQSNKSNDFIKTHPNIKEIENIRNTLDKLNKKSLSFYKKRKKHLKVQNKKSKNAIKAQKDYSLYREQLLTCKARTIKPDKVQRAMKWKSMTYLIAIGSVVWGYHRTEGWDKEKGWEKFILEIGMNMLSTTASNQNVLFDGTTTGEKMIIKYALTFLISLLEKTIYKERFEKDLVEELENSDFFKSFVKQLVKNKELNSIFKRVERASNRKLEIQNILSQYKFDPNKEVISSAQADAFFEMLTVAQNYESLHHDNILIKTGEESKDRFIYNNSYGALSAVKSILIGLFTYNLTCQSKAIGPYLIAGNSSKNVAIFIGTFIFMLDKFISTEIYYGGREKLIKQ